MTQQNKFPRIPHLPWSSGTSDDRILKDINCFNRKDLVVTGKMDGECTSMTSNHIWARSLESADHPSQHWVKGLWGNIRYRIPAGMTICGENVFAKHSIYYDNLPSYFLVFGVFDRDEYVTWEYVEHICHMLGLFTVPVLMQRPKDKSVEDIRDIFANANWENQEGYVIRNADAFHRLDFNANIAKFVRSKHVQTDKHWKFQKMIKNQLR